MNTISHYEVLGNGTKVKVKNMTGRVISHEVAKDQFGKDIVVHTIEFTKHVTQTSGIKNINKIIAVNYSGIRVM
jgi:hypothetical protein